jgi:hypothetical protein
VWSSQWDQHRPKNAPILLAGLLRTAEFSGGMFSDSFCLGETEIGTGGMIEMIAATETGGMIETETEIETGAALQTSLASLTGIRRLSSGRLAGAACAWTTGRISRRRGLARTSRCHPPPSPPNWFSTSTVLLVQYDDRLGGGGGGGRFGGGSSWNRDRDGASLLEICHPTAAAAVPD